MLRCSNSRCIGRRWCFEMGPRLLLVLLQRSELCRCLWEEMGR